MEPAEPNPDPDLSRLDDPATPIYTIGQAAELLDVGPGVLRRLDERGIVSPERSEGGQRRYSRDQLERVREAVALTDEGMTLAGVVKVLDLRDRVAELEDEVAALRQDG